MLLRQHPCQDEQPDVVTSLSRRRWWLRAGDRVEVRWKDALYEAVVIRVHSAGMVDVVYDGGGTLGIFLTAAEHGLNKLPRRKSKSGKRRKVCSVAGCPSTAEGSAKPTARKMAAPPRHEDTVHDRGLHHQSSGTRIV